ncbi:MAG: hypothetical protein NVS2B17_04330 [Candidatus Velthaea sp.]
MQAQRLQSFLRESVRTRARAIACGPFDCFLDPHDPLIYLNYAVPREPVDAPAAAAALPGLDAVFAEYDRVPRFEFVAAFAPALPLALERYGYIAEPGSFAMNCGPDDLRIPVLEYEHELLIHDDRTPDAEIAEALHVRDTSFGIVGSMPEADAIAAYRKAAGRSKQGVVRSGGTIAAVGQLTAAWEGVAEIAGIGVRANMRRRGFGSAITAFLAQRAFAAGTERLHLTAADARAASMYARVGFSPASHTVLSYIRNQA